MCRLPDSIRLRSLPLALLFAGQLLLADDSIEHELALVSDWLEAQIAYDRVPGVAAAIVHDQELVWSGAFGRADLESGEPVTTDTIFGICSISKLFTGIAAMQLRDQGRLSVDDTVESLLPWFNLGQTFEGSPPITLQGVLTHSAGLPRESDSPYWMGPDFAFPTRAAVRETMAGQSTIYPAARYYQYSNLGLTLVGEIVAEISGQAYATYVEDNILDPLGLEDTTVGFPADDRETRIATGYGFPGRDGRLPRMPRYDTRGIAPAAGLTSTVLDLADFASWQFRLMGGESDDVLAANTLREMQRAHWLEHDWSVARGLAFGNYRIGERTLVGHGGHCPGFRTQLYLDPLTEYAVVLFANRNGVDVGRYATTILDILEAGATPEPADETETAAVVDYGEYLGSYDYRPWSGEELIFRWKDGLAVVALPTMDPLGELVRLEHIEGDRFHTIRDDDEPGHEVLFRRDESGDVTHIIHHSIDLPKLD